MSSAGWPATTTPGASSWPRTSAASTTITSSAATAARSSTSPPRPASSGPWPKRPRRRPRSRPSKPTAADGRAMASARYVIENGIGYDAWADKLLKANPAGNRGVLNVGDLVGVKPGGNPHRWYSPPDVQKAIDQITADYKRVAPQSSAYFDQQRTTFTTQSLARYDALIAAVKTKYSGAAVGASESIFTPMAEALGLNLRTPETFLDAISEGSEPTAADKATCDAQIKTHQIKVYVFNSQNSTPDVQAQVHLAQANGIAVVPITETLTPTSATFQDWQANQLQSLAAALGKA